MLARFPARYYNRPIARPVVAGLEANRPTSSSSSSFVDGWADAKSLHHRMSMRSDVVNTGVIVAIPKR